MPEQKVTDALRWVVGIFEKHQIPYQIAGGFAARLYGATRPINDIDIDLPRRYFDTLLSEVKEYVVSPPTQYKGEKWDIYEMRLMYNGQEIDLTAEECNIFDEATKTWVPSNADLSKSETIEFEGMQLKVCPRQALINYKKLLNGEHQKQDIREITL